MARAEVYLKAGRPADAYDALLSVEVENAGNVRFDYLLGISAIDSGHISGAIFALERAVAEQPTNSLAHAELGRAYLKAGEATAAKQELETARLGSMPPEAAATIDRILGSMEAAPILAKGPVFKGYIDLAAGYDSNLNSATGNGQFALPAFGGIIFTLDPINQRRGSPFMALAGSGEIQVPLTAAWSVTGSANGRGTFTSSDHDLQQRQLDTSLGAAYARQADTFTASVQTSTFWLDAERYRSANGVVAQWQHSLQNAAQISGFAQLSNLTYPGQSVRDADRTVLGLGYAKAFARTTTEAADQNATVLYGSLYGAREKAKTSGFENFGHDAVGFRAGIEYQDGSHIWFASAQYENRRYGGPEPFFDATRHDKQADIAIGLRYAISSNWRITPQASTTYNASNVALYEYRRTVYQVILRHVFK